MSSPDVLRKELIVLFGFPLIAATRHYPWSAWRLPGPEDAVSTPLGEDPFLSFRCASRRA